MPMQCQSNIFQVKSCRSMSCNASQGIRNCYNHCLSTFANPWFIRINWWILVDHGSNHIVILIDFLHPPVTWHLFPVAIWVRNNVFQGRCLPNAWRGWIPGARHYPLVVSGCQYLLEFCWNFVGILLVILIDAPISPGISMDFRRFPGARQRLAMLSFRTQIKQRALLVEFNGDCALKIMRVYQFMSCNVLINPL